MRGGAGVFIYPALQEKLLTTLLALAYCLQCTLGYHTVGRARAHYHHQTPPCLRK